MELLRTTDYQQMWHELEKQAKKYQVIYISKTDLKEYMMSLFANAKVITYNENMHYGHEQIFNNILELGRGWYVFTYFLSRNNQIEEHRVKLHGFQYITLLLNRLNKLLENEKKERFAEYVA